MNAHYDAFPVGVVLGVFVPLFGDLIAINSSLVPHFGESQIIAICFFVWMYEILLIYK
jgi:hypothetical protein